MSTNTARRSRNDSPAPKSQAAKAAAKSAPATLTPATAAKPTETKKEEANTIFGFHPEVFKAVVVGPAVVLVLIFVTVFFDLGNTAVRFVMQHWHTYSAPVAKFLDLKANVDLILILTALVVMSPFLIVLVVNIWGAMMDLGHLAYWQQLALGVLVFTALATACTTETLNMVATSVKGMWDKSFVRAYVEDMFKNKQDSIIAGVAICCMAPIIAAMFGYAVRAIWGCRVKIVVEKEKAQETK